MIHEPELDEDGFEKDSKLKKIILFAVSVFLILLMSSWVLVTYPVGNIIEGWFASTPLEDNKLVLDGFTIVFENNVQKELRKLYLEEQKVEFSVCLQGVKEKSKEQDTYKIHSLYVPVMFEQTFNHVSFEPCKDSLIILHSHPYKSCIASETDLNTLNSTQQVTPETVMVVMCEPERFSVYS
jgi:proteasome lid subunit RPN8/RPN11